MYTFIVNPHARSGLGGQIWHKLEQILQKRNVPYEVYFTKFQRHATAIVQELTSDTKEHTVVVLGGDGSVNEAVNGLTRFEGITFGYIPIGSSNDFARSFNLPTDPFKALDIILSPKGYAQMNVGVLSYKNRTKRFAVSAGAGFDAAVCHQAVISRLKVFLNKIHLGKLSYAGIALHRIVHLRCSDLTLALDDREPLHFPKVMFAAVMNLPYEGGGFKFCPEADPCDGLLNVMVISGVPKWKALLLLPLAFQGKHVRFRGVYTYACKKAVLKSGRALAVHTDGEPVFLQKDLEASLKEDALKVIVR